MSDPTLPRAAASAALPADERSSLASLALPLFLGALAGRMLVYTLARPDDDPWLVCDWLINYAGGMVRRGLSGELLLGLSSLTGQTPATLTGVLQLLCFAALLAGLYRLARPLPVNLPMVLLLASPALLQLYIHNPHGGLRKEILLLAVLAPFCARLAFDARPVERLERLLLALTLALITLCHEMLFAYMPLFLIAMRLTPRAPTTPVLRDALILLPAAVCTVWIVIFHRGDSSIVAAICASLAAQAPSDCGAGDPFLGAISFLAVDTGKAIDYMRYRTPPPIAISYLIGALLSLVPFVVATQLSNIGSLLHRREPRWLALLLAAVVAQVLVLNAIAVDHGRFIHILITGMTLVLLLAMHAQGESLQFSRPRHPRLALVMAVIFVLGWKLKHAEMWPGKLLWWSKWLVAA